MHQHLVQTSRYSYWRAALAIARKDWLHFARYPMDAVFRVLQPIMWLTPAYFLGRSFATDQGALGFAAYAGTVDYMSFIIVGAVISSYVTTVFWGMGYALKREMDSGVLESNWMTPVPRPLFLIGQTLSSIAITTLTNVGLVLLAALFFGFRIGGNVVPALLAVLPMLAALYGFGFAFAALVLLMRDANTLVDVSEFVVTQLSGSSYPVQVLPRSLLLVSLALPLTYGYDAVRGLLLNSRTLLPVPYEIAILCGFMLLMTMLGALVFSRVERRCKQLGTLGQH